MSSHPSFLFINLPRDIKGGNIWRYINSQNPPFGLLSLDSILRKHGVPSKVLDASALTLSNRNTLHCIDEYDPHIIGLTATTVEWNNVAAFAGLVRQQYPHKKILMGGVHPTLFHDDIVARGIADYVIRGEGEIPIALMARAVNSDLPLSAVPGLTWMENGKVVTTETMNIFANLDELPIPYYEQLPMDKYHSARGAAKLSPSIGMITSRGCPGKCTFCYSGMFGTKIRMQSPAKIMQHMQHLRDTYGIREISFYDDTFTVNKTRVKHLCGSLLTEPVGKRFSWSCFARVDSVTPEMLTLMGNAGCHQVSYGFESVSDKVLGNINKMTTAAKYREVIEWTHSAGMDVRGAFMIGNDGDTEDSIIESIRFAISTGIRYAMFNITTPLPGTALYDWAHKGSRLLTEDFNRYDLATPVMRVDSISPRDIARLYRRAYRMFYLRAGYIWDHITKRT